MRTTPSRSIGPPFCILTKHTYQLRFNHVRGRSRPPLRKRQNPTRFCSHLCLSRICSWHSQIQIRLAGICRNHTVEERTCIPLRPPFHFLSHLRVCSRGKSCRSCLLTRDELRFTNQLEQTEELAVLQLLLVLLRLLRSAWGGLGTALGLGGALLGLWRYVEKRVRKDECRNRNE